jgi:replicative DNA helicase
MNSKAETKIIGYSLMTENPHQIAEIDIKYFQVQLHKEIHQKISLIERKGGELTPATLITELNRDRNEDISPTINDILTATIESIEVFDLPVLLKELEEAYVRSEGWELALKIQKIMSDKTLNTTEIINAVKDDCSIFVDGISFDDQYPLKYIAEGIADKMNSLSQGIKAISTGIKELDDITQGFAPKELIVLGGRPADGKTYTGLIVADSIVKKGTPAVFFSAEMSREELATRFLGKEYFEAYSEILPRGKMDGLVPLTELEFARISDIYERKLDYPIIVQDKPGSILTLADIKKDLLTAKETYGQIGIVVIDYLQLIAKSEQGQLLTYAIGELLNGLKLLAYEFNCPFLLLAQLNTRNVGNRGDKRPYCSDLSDSAQLEKYANKILLLYRESKYNPDADPSDLEIIVAKNRSGREGTVKCSFDMETGVLKGRD